MSSSPSQPAERYFSTKAATYHSESSRGLWRWFRSMETRAVLAAATPEHGEAILDAGCGAGHYSEVLVKAGAAVTSLDASAPMLDSLRSRLNVETIQADLSTVTLQPRFDKIVCLGVLEFVPDAHRVLANLAAGLRPDGPGELVILAPAKSLRGGIYRSYHRRHGVGVRLFSRSDLDALADAAGMWVESVTPVTFNLVALLRRASG